MSKIIGPLLVAMLIVSAPLHVARAQVPEIANPAHPDIAMAMMTPTGPVIIYNPNICNSMGLLACRFFRAHEYAHIILGHVLGGTHPAFAEMQADCWAAQNAQQSEVIAVINVFNMTGAAGDAMHGTGLQRAQRVHDARTSGNCHW